jgi:hypothetical protein
MPLTFSAAFFFVETTNYFFGRCKTVGFMGVFEGPELIVT